MSTQPIRLINNDNNNNNNNNITVCISTWCIDIQALFSVHRIVYVYSGTLYSVHRIVYVYRGTLYSVLQHYHLFNWV